MNLIHTDRQAAGRKPSTLSAPTSVVVRRLFTGTNVIKWKHPRRKDEVFVVEARAEGDQAWSEIAVVSGRKYNHMDHPQGVGIAYRIKTQRGLEQSAPTPEIILPSQVTWPLTRPAACLYGFSREATGTV